MNRRQFVSMAAGGGLATRLSVAAGPSRLPIRKGVSISMLPKNWSLPDRMQAAADAGFSDLECETVSDPKEAEAIKSAAERARLRIHSVANSAHWEFPLNSPDPEVVSKGMASMDTSLRNAHFWGADTVLLVPAVVSPLVSYYQDAWTRSQRQIRQLLPLAEELKVVIAVEEVWNRFLVSPLEFVRYVDEFRNPWLKAYMDVGNVVFYGYPQDWIRTLGKRIAKMHLKDFRYRNERTEWVALGEGDIDWPEVHRALAEVGYHGTATVELPGGDATYLKEVSRRVSAILDGKRI